MSKFDELLNQIRDETADPAIAAHAGEQVRRNLFGPGAAGVENIRGCEDFRSLIPAYLQRTLSGARRMLLEDHTHECVPCRQALDRARSGGRSRPLVLTSRPAGYADLSKWAIAAALVVGVGLTAMAALTFAPTFMGGTAAEVQLVNGTLYRVANHGSVPLGAGQDLAYGEEIRTPAGSKAMVRLADGSRIEMNERADLSVTRGWRGTTIRLERGHIIVQAAKQKLGRLHVATGDGTVTVKGTIFSVNRGSIGTRVSVVEGQVLVDHGGRTESLKPGDQTRTNPAIAPSSVSSEIAWSSDSARYLALLGEFNALQRRIEAIPGQGLRYSSRLLLFVPEDTMLFAAIPNMGVTLTEAKRIFDERLQVSAVLRDWWNAPQNANLRSELDEIFDLLRTLTNYIGDEMVVSIGSGSKGSPVLMAEVRGSGLGEFLEAQFQRAGKKPFDYSIRNNTLIVAAEPARLHEVEAALARGGAPSTAFRERIQQAYQSGAGWLLCANMEQILKHSVKKEGGSNRLPASSGLDAAQYLILERREIGGRTDNRVSLTFKGERAGVASWLAAPGPMSALGFVSPDASAAWAAVVKSPRAMLEDLFLMAREKNPEFDTKVAEFENKTGLKLADDLAAPLGSEVAFATDGPLLPTPAWKFVVEVNAQQRLQWSIERLIDAWNREAAAEAGKITLASETVGQRTFYVLSSEKFPVQAHYTYVDSYLFAASSRALLVQAIENRQTGNTLLRSERFRSDMPYANSPNFSAVFYHNLGTAVGPVLAQLKDLPQVSAAERQSMAALAETAPGVIGVYGESDRIVLATTGGFFGFNPLLLFPGAWQGRK